MSKQDSNGLIIGMKISLLILFIYFTNAGFSPRLQFLVETNNTVTIIVFFILWILSIMTILIAAFQQNWLVRFFWATIIGIVTGVSYGFYAAGGTELEVLDALELWQARHESARAVEFFLHALIKAGFVALIGFIIIILPVNMSKIKHRLYLKYLMWAPLIPISLFIVLIFIKSDRAIAGLPQQFVPLSIAGAISYKLSTTELPKRDVVSSDPESTPKMRNLVYLVDESINPDYLYESKGKLLKGFADNISKISNYGVAVSGSNCSARSNAILRLGATRDNLIEMIRTSPTIWQYAKKAGFRTVFIDAQDSSKVATKPNDFQNYMTNAEAAYIDKFYKIKNIDAPELDFKLLEILKAELDNNSPTFVYANKNGAHFPYHNNYPESEAIYQPVAGVTTSKGIGGLADLYEDSGMTGVLNSYRNSLYWTVDKFFRKLFNEINLDDTVVIYTSDHGQYFEQHSTTHCTSGDGAPATEGLVPLMLMTNKSELKSVFNSAAIANYNQVDQFSIFPTLLDLMGYSEKTKKAYGTDLLSTKINRIDAETAFNTGDIMGIFSKDTIWRTVTQDEKIKSMPNIPAKP